MLKLLKKPERDKEKLTDKDERKREGETVEKDVKDVKPKDDRPKLRFSKENREKLKEKRENHNREKERGTLNDRNKSSRDRDRDVKVMIKQGVIIWRDNKQK